MATYYKFTAESDQEIIPKTGQHLAKLHAGIYTANIYRYPA